MQKAQEQLLQLKRQQEQIEKQKRELEELSRRQEELEHGRAEMADKLTRSLVVLEREAYNAQNRLEQIRAARESFGQHLELIEAIDPRSWNPSDLHKELSRALSTVDEARTVYNEQRSRLQAAGRQLKAMHRCPTSRPMLYESSDGRSFFHWLQIGLALTLPLILFGAVVKAPKTPKKDLYEAALAAAGARPRRRHRGPTREEGLPRRPSPPPRRPPPRPAETPAAPAEAAAEATDERAEA